MLLNIGKALQTYIPTYVPDPELNQKPLKNPLFLQNIGWATKDVANVAMVK